MGERRSSYRHLAPALAAAGFRVAVLDLRGHGDSDASFDRYDDVALAGDIRALIAELGGPAALFGSSMGAAGAVIVAGEHPELVWAAVLSGPFVRDLPRTGAQRLMQRIALSGPLARRTWTSFSPKLVPGRRPDDFDAHVADIAAGIKGRRRRHAFSRTTRTSHEPADAVVDSVRAPVLIVMGTADPDFPDPKAEAHMIARRTHGDVAMIADAGHYPHDQAADAVRPLVVDFLRAKAPHSKAPDA
jgi:pimeloyl-ACP methyl ester carboxylesterase